MGLLDGRVAIVTGGAGGIGSASCRKFAAEGAKVAVADVDLDGARAVAESIGPDAIAVWVDAEVPDTIYAMVEATVAAFGTVCVLHNNAALTSVMPDDTTVLDVDLEIWNRTFDVNLRGYLVGCKAVIPHMIASGGGSIVNTASIGGIFGGLLRSSYAASKAGIMALTRDVALQHGRDGIRCNAIAPGLIVTEAVERNEPDIVNRLRSHIAVERLGRPEDVANLACFLASDDAGYVSGQTIACDGALSAKLGYVTFE